MIIRILLIAVVSALLAGCGKARWPEAQAITLEGRTGLPLAATLHRPLNPTPPGLLLLHGYGASQQIWDGFAERACHEGYMVMTLDLPGHGNSAWPPDRHSLDTLSAEDWLAMRHDIALARDRLVSEGADAANLGVVGALLGANLALQYAHLDTSIEAVVLLSPRLEDRGVSTEAVMAAFAERPVLFLAGQRDTQGAIAANALKALAPGHSEIRFYESSVQGADLFAAHPNSMDQILEWLSAIIGPRQQALK